MEEERTQVIETPHAATASEVRTDVNSVESVTYDPFAGRRNAAQRLTQLVYWVFGLVEGLIVIRLVLKSLGANPSAGFAEFIYGITVPLVSPFVGLFNNPTYQSSVLEVSAITALIVYALVAWLIAKLVWIVLGETRSAIHARTTHLDSRI